ncbi:Pre-mRNA-splicing factor [Yamadazyma tenuis]|uniref:Pre-mRNA-splicing factor CWC2 n=1 Tax=Candida tenuis (strain ATCC 10573 / BCRC 21748 / CBS 615 / JCM 9827 / NBRC 10315 / NRRL Y-1498 / VKM Y-70) TaxID=590646 RepID=G3BEJ9_CANTC|nr:uncharacterized protein CANTEDRAFT_116641 [Yamadazyma tenuis ATCC 10573]XP_006690410.1 uncharacterized protein CANTEDRAFT_116641 [Yamadazyma tenuis ATCC 10573]EGV61195.1 hypothetical protein CANTEDRAFT_116641 [Yamadazyma tenuis ATCC 10573]EGV61196.1 hypothetical protein CANTEDRAFT_116641 [Yamadazyma tenuis ATCC 10573]WEJ94195.1 Pre-mRNA-splicing factor [Yamadazyma tenuis]
MNRPARVQVDPSSLPDDRPPQTGNVFNVWYLKWSGGDGSKNYEKSRFRVDITRDSGRTKANKSLTSTICLYFGRGCCYRGKSCDFLHRLPCETDYFPPTQDCFGRDKTFAHRDDMDGVGALNKINDTIYVSGLHPGDHTESVLSRHFSEFGSIAKIKVLYNKSCAFITFKHEFEAQFAKEAMQCQSLDDNEVLMIRWANDDPDPTSQVEKKRKLEEITVNTVKNLLNRQQQEHEESETEDPEIVEPEEPASPEHEPGQKLLEHSIFNQNSLSVLSKLKKRKMDMKPKDPPKTLDLSGYSSDEE